MAVTSVWGISGWDPLASYGEGLMNSYFSTQSMKNSAKTNYKYAKKYALNAPSWNVQGLRSAGINPILAVNGGNIGDVTNPNVAPFAVDTGSATRGGFDRRAFEEQKLAFASQRAEINVNSSLADKTKSEELKTLVQSLNDLQDGGSKGVEGIARMAGRSFGEDGGVFDHIASEIFKRIGKLLGIDSTNSAQDHKSDDGKVVPAPNSAKSSVSSSGDDWYDSLDSESRQVIRRLRRRDFDNKYKDKKYGDVKVLHFGH